VEKVRDTQSDHEERGGDGFRGRAVQVVSAKARIGSSPDPE
jgi:hypothetical protein